jgi:hypothetical protein
MQIQVFAVNHVRKEMRVHFRCEWGEGEARWAGQTPTLDSDHDVELAIPKALTWGATIRPAVETQPAISCSREGNRLVALLAKAESDGTVVLRLGPAIIVGEADGTPSAAPGSWVLVRTANIVLYPFRP